MILHSWQPLGSQFEEAVKRLKDTQDLAKIRAAKEKEAAVQTEPKDVLLDPIGTQPLKTEVAK